jgi:hypothetical protein
LDKAFNYINGTMDRGSFQIKSPDNHLGIAIVNNNDPVLAAIYILGNDSYAINNRRNLMTYEVQRYNNSTNIKITASLDGGKMLNCTGKPDNIIFRDVRISGQSLPDIPDKIEIGQGVLQNPSPEPKPVPPNPAPNPTGVNDDPQTAHAKTIGQQNTGLPIASLLLAFLLVIGGLVSRKK